MGHQLPEEAGSSVVTLAELELGVHLAATDEATARRLRTLGATQSMFVAIPIVSAVASAFAELVALARGDGRRPKVQDTRIAATAPSTPCPSTHRTASSITGRRGRARSSAQAEGEAGRVRGAAGVARRAGAR